MRMLQNRSGSATLRALVVQFSKFAGVGLLAFAIDYGIMVLLVEAVGFDSVAAATVSYVASVVVNYFMSMRFVFRHKAGMTRRREFAIFVVLAAIGLGINDLLLWVATDGVGIDYRIAKFGVAAIVTLWNFFSRKALLDAGR